MKTPEHWRTSRDPRWKVPSPQSPFAMMDVLPWQLIMHKITFHDFRCLQILCMRMRQIHSTLCLTGTVIAPQRPKFNCQKSRYLTWWPWPLTYHLDHKTWLRYYKGASPHQNSCPYVERFSGESAELQTDTDTPTHTGRILLPRPLTREVMKQIKNQPVLSNHNS